MGKDLKFDMVNEAGIPYHKEMKGILSQKRKIMEEDRYGLFMCVLQHFISFCEPASAVPVSPQCGKHYMYNMSLTQSKSLVN